MGHFFVMDNFYNSISLSNLLMENHTDSYVTVKFSRKNTPEPLIFSKLDPGKILAYMKDKILILKFQDKRSFNMISTVHKCKMIETKTRTNKKLKPELSNDYNKKIYSVDLVDQNISNYIISRSRGENIISIFSSFGSLYVECI